MAIGSTALVLLVVGLIGGIGGGFALNSISTQGSINALNSDLASSQGELLGVQGS